MNTRSIGTAGEEKAVQYLIQSGFKIISRNFRKRGFEIDIVALDKNNVLRLVEVKTVVDGSVEDAVHSIEQRNIRNYEFGFNSFLNDHPIYINYEASMDVCVINGEMVLYYGNVTGGRLV
jgi:putative endonuclease